MKQVVVNVRTAWRFGENVGDPLLVRIMLKKSFLRVEMATVRPFSFTTMIQEDCW